MCCRATKYLQLSEAEIVRRVVLARVLPIYYCTLEAKNSTMAVRVAFPIESSIRCRVAGRQ